MIIVDDAEGWAATSSLDGTVKSWRLPELQPLVTLLFGRLANTAASWLDVGADQGKRRPGLLGAYSEIGAAMIVGRMVKPIP